MVGVTVGAVALIFPTLEDAYWRQADPQRVWKNESIDSMEDDSGKMAPPKLSSSWSSNLTAKTGKEESEVKKKKNLVILGTGWAAVSLLKHIDRDLYNINIVSPRNYFLFTPLLPVRSNIGGTSPYLLKSLYYIIEYYVC